MFLNNNPSLVTKKFHPRNTETNEKGRSSTMHFIVDIGRHISYMLYILIYPCLSHKARAALHDRRKNFSAKKSGTCQKKSTSRKAIEL
jgi:hypothetical protein